MRARVLLAAGVALLVLTAACGSGGQQVGPDDPRAAGIAALAEMAVQGYGGDPGGLYPYLLVTVQQKCPLPALAKALADQERPSALRKVNKVSLKDDTAIADLDVITARGDANVEWTFTRLVNGRWTVSYVPGLEKCTG